METCRKGSAQGRLAGFQATRRLRSAILRVFGGGEQTSAPGCMALAEPLEQRMMLDGDVVISEFMASNKNSIQDVDGDHSDWIELYNRGDQSVDLGGWYLTDNSQDLTQWRFPSKTIAPGGYLVVFASGKNRTDPSAELHTNFKLDAGGEYLGLIEPDAVTPHSQYAPTFPTQSQDVSYGLTTPDDPDSTMQFFATATPGAANQPNAISPVFSVGSGTFTGSLVVTLSTTQPGGTIRYTTDGSIPTSRSQRYTGPITLSRSRIVRARTFATGKTASPVITRTYEAVDSTVQNFDTNLPIVVVDTFGRGMNDTSLTTAAAYFIDTSSADGRAQMLDGVDWAGRIGIRLRGQSSQGFPKAPYALETWDENDGDQSVSLLGMPKESDWILYDPYSEKSLMQNYLAYEWANSMGEYAVRTRYVELFLNNNGDTTVNYNSDYVGVYILMEKIKIDSNRVDINKLTPSDNTGIDVTGGYIWKKDKFDSGETGFATSSGQTWLNVEPAASEITTQQQAYLTGYINEFESVLYGPNFADPVNGYAKYIDVNSFIDNWILVEMTKNIDGFRLSTYYYKDKGGKIHMGPVWDYNLSLGNADYYGGNNPSGWYSDQLGDGDYPYWRRLFQDPNFKQRLVDRWEELRTDELSTSTLLGDVDDLVKLLSDGNGNYPVGNSPTQAPNNPVVRNFEKWHVLGTYVWPNGYYDPQGRWIEDVNWMKNWLAQRVNWMDSQFIKTPTLSQPGGKYTTPLQLTISAAGSNPPIYYTTDGSDPRLPGGGINPSAIRYTGPISITGTTRIRARIYGGTNVWGGLADEIYNFGQSPLRVTEIMYNPAPAAANSPYLPGDFEFIELQNTGDSTLNLAGYALTDGVEFTFAGGQLAPGDYAVVVKNQAAFVSRYGASIPVAGVYSGSLSDGGEQIKLKGPVGETVQKFNYKDGWYPQTDGEGFSLVINDPQADETAWDNGAAWHASAYLYGNPGAGDTGLPDKSIVINELMSTATAPSGNWVELHNTSDSPIDISGWYLSSSKNNLQQYQIPGGVVIGAGGYYLLNQAGTFGAAGNPGVTTPIVLTALGGNLYLSSNDPSGQAGGYRQSVSFGPQTAGVSFGRFVKTTGGDDFVAQSHPTPGAPNAAPLIGPVVINEIMANPPAGDQEFIELRNLSNEAVPLFDPANPGNAWKFMEGIVFTFPASAQIPADGYAVVVGGDPAEFRTKHNIPANIPIYGPYTLADGTNVLENHGEKLTLSRPAMINGSLAYIEADHVNYDDEAPWASPSPAASWGRIDSSAFGNDAGNWGEEMAGGTPGSVNLGSPPPEVTIPAVIDDNGLPVDTVTIKFNKSVHNVDLSDLVLSRNGGPNLLTNAQWLVTSDNVTFTLGNLGALSFVQGDYTLSIDGDDTDIVDSKNNPLSNSASVTWTMDATSLNGTSGNDAWIIGQTATELLIWLNAPTTADPTFRAPIGSINLLALVPGGGNDTVRVDSATVNLSADTTGKTALTVNGASVVTLAAGQVLSSLTLNDQAQVVMPSDGQHSLIVSKLAMTGNSSLDLGNNDLMVSYSGDMQNVVRPGDPIQPLGNTVAGSPNGDAGSSPGAETVDHAIDGYTQKYLNFGAGNGLNTGFYTTPTAGPSVVTGLRIFTANDAPERDPASYTLEGTNDDPSSPTAVWTLISLGDLALPGDRNPGGNTSIDPATQANQLVTFDNSASYSSYRVLFPTAKGPGQNSIQIGEAQLLATGTSPEADIEQYVSNWVKNSAGPRLIASHAAAAGFSQSGRTLAVFDNHDFHGTSFHGQALKGYNQVLVKYTYLGDANGDGKVDPTDYAVVDGKIGLGHSWITGDLNFDGKVDPSDYAQIDGNQGAGQGGDGGPQLSLAGGVQSSPAAAAPVSGGGEMAVASEAGSTQAAPLAAAAASPFSTTPINPNADLLGVQQAGVL